MEKLEIKQLSHRFAFTEVLKDISFTLQKGQVISVVGPSGCGKTTLLRLASNLLDVEQGEVNNSFQSSAFAFQEARLLPWKNVIDNISLGLLAKGYKKKDALLSATEMAIKFGLTKADLKKYPKDLSGGMRQRVSFARALVVNPALLFLDEPFSALDIGLKKELQTILIEMITNKLISILFITHDLMEAIKLSDQVLLLKSEPGEIVKTFTYLKPQHLRDDHFVYNEGAKILQDKQIIKTFELELKQ